MIDNRRDEAAKYLDFLNGKIPAIPNPVFEKAVKDMESKDVVIPEKIKTAEQPKKSTNRMNVDEIKSMLAEGKSIRQIADHYGYKATQTVYLFMDSNGITTKQLPKQEPKKVEPKQEVSKKVEKRVLTEVDIPRIRDQYTAGKMCLADMAKELGVGNGELYAFAEKNGLIRKPVKSNDPFRDKNRMGKDEFKTKMLAGKK
jgi:transposase